MVFYYTKNGCNFTYFVCYLDEPNEDEQLLVQKKPKHVPFQTKYDQDEEEDGEFAEWFQQNADVFTSKERNVLQCIVEKRLESDDADESEDGAEKTGKTIILLLRYFFKVKR